MKNIKLFIHIGTHKTGTTSIQSSLNESGKILKKENIYYYPLSKNALQLMKIKELDYEIIDTCKKELFRFIKKRKNKNSIKIIWSFEGFSGDPSAGYENTKIIAESLKKITNEIETKVIVYLREQDDFIESLYTQMIHQGEFYDFKTFIESTPNHGFNWNNLLNNYSMYFGQENLIVRKYEKYYLSNNGGIVNDFVKILDSNLKLNKPSKLNRGYSRDALEIARILNPSLSIAERHQLRRLLRNVSTKKSFENYSFWNNNERSHYMNMFTNSNNKVAKEFFNDSTGGLFNNDSKSSSSKSEYSGLTPESIVNIFGKIILDQNNRINYSSTSKLLRRTKNLFIRIHEFLF